MSMLYVYILKLTEGTLYIDVCNPRKLFVSVKYRICKIYTWAHNIIYIVLVDVNTVPIRLTCLQLVQDKHNI